MSILKLMYREAKSTCLSLLIILLSLFAYPAFADEKICFANHKGLPHHGNLPPTIDGYVGREFGINTSELEQGWNGSSLVSYGRGGNIADIEFRGIKNRNQPFIYLSFVVRYDEAFDDNDAIVILLRPGPPGASHISGERRIHVFPLYGGAGAGNPDDPASFSTSTESGYDFRKNALERTAEFYKWQAGSFVAATRPDNLEIRVRSWDGADKNWSVEMKVPTSTAVANGGSDWINLPDDFGIYFDVIRVCDTCDTEPVTGYFSNQFTWPRVDYSVDPPTGLLLDPDSGAVLLHEIDIEPEWVGPAKMLSSATADCGGVRISGGHSGIGVRQAATGPTGTSIHATDPNTFVAKLINEGTDNADGVRAEFRIANWGISSGAPGVWDKVDPDTGFVNPTSRVTIPADGAVHELTTRWTLNSTERAQYGTTLSTHQCVWVTLDSNQDVNFSQSSYWNNMSITGLSSVSRLAEINAQGWGSPAGPDGNQEFRMKINQRYLFHPGLKEVSDSFRGATESFNMAAVSRDSFDVFGLPEINNFRDDILRNVKANVKFGVFPRFKQPKDSQYFILPEERIMFSELMQKPEKSLWGWVWMASVNRKTTYTLTMAEKKYRVYEPAGEFGHFGLHEGLKTNFTDTITNQITENPPSELIELVQQSGEEAYVMYLGDDEVSRLSTRLEAEPMKEEVCKDTFCKKCPKQSNIAMNAETPFLIAGIGILGLVGYRKGKRNVKNKPDNKI